MSSQYSPVDEADFDPTDGRFLFQQQRPGELHDVDLASVAPVMRALLVIDGTVTKFLEAYFFEPVIVRRLSQSVELLDRDDDWLEAAVGDQIVSREVMLVGAVTGRAYTYARSNILLSKLSVRMRQALDDENMGLGRILLDSKAEVRRECLWFGGETTTQVPDSVSRHCGTEFVCRAYRVVLDRQPIMLITEYFPESLA